MPAEDLDTDRPRRSALAVLLRRTPFTLVLPGCTVAGVEAAARDAEVPRSWRLRVRDGVLVLRNYGDGVYVMTWSVKAQLEQTPEGVRLAGRLRYLGSRLQTGMLVLFVLFLFGVGAWLGLTHGPRHHEYAGALGAGAVMALPTLFILALLPGTARRQQARMKQLLHDLLVDG